MASTKLELIRKARDLPLQQFLGQFGQLVFFAYGLGPSEPTRVEFKTSAYPSVPRRTLASTQVVSQIPPAGRISQAPDGILPIVKSENNPFPDRVSIGRSEDCDLVLPVAHLSKLHAHFLHDTGVGWYIRDAESTNGTFVNGVRAEPGTRVRVRSGDHLRLAHCEGRFLDATQLFALLSLPPS